MSIKYKENKNLVNSFEFELMLKTQRAFDVGVIIESDYKMKIQLLSQLLSDKRKDVQTSENLQFYRQFIDKKLSEYYSKAGHCISTAERLKPKFEKFTNSKLSASDSMSNFRKQHTDVTANSTISGYICTKSPEKNPCNSNRSEEREKSSKLYFDKTKMESLDCAANRLMIEMQKEFGKGNISESDYRRMLTVLLDMRKNNLSIDESVADEMVAEKLRLYFKAMNSRLNEIASGSCSSAENSRMACVEATKFSSTVYKLTDQQLADRFLNGNKTKSSRIISAVKPSFAGCVKTLLGSIEILSNPTTGSKSNGENDVLMEKVKGENKKQDRRQKRKELESEDALFRTAKEQLQNLELAKGVKRGYTLTKKPKTNNENEAENKFSPEVAEIMNDDRGKILDSSLVEKVLFDIVENIASITWEDISGLEFAKESIREIVILPMLRPDLFKGLRSPCKGLLLFGPPGTGKTLIGKCIASESQSTFFSISASSLTSKYIGEGEKMVRTLFTIARIKQPAVIFIDEIDSLLTQRTDTEHEASRRLKTEFLVQFDGLTTDTCERLLVIGATNRPQELDEAARRRFVKRLYIPLPTKSARRDIINHLMKNENHNLTEEDCEKICILTDGYSGSDVTNLCKEAALGPIRKVGTKLLIDIKESALPPISMSDFMVALKIIKASVSDGDLVIYEQFNHNFGAVSVPKEEEDTRIE